MSTWKILRGNNMDSAADVSPCLHAWNWGWALWSKWKRTAEVWSPGEFKLRAAEQVRKCFHLRIFPDSPAESTFCDHSPRNTAGCCLASCLSWHGLKPFGIPVKKLDRCQICTVNKTDLLYFNDYDQNVLASVHLKKRWLTQVEHMKNGILDIWS